MKKFVILLLSVVIMIPATLFASSLTEEKEEATNVKTLMTDKEVFKEPVIRSGSTIPFFSLT